MKTFLLRHKGEWKELAPRYGKPYMIAKIDSWQQRIDPDLIHRIPKISHLDDDWNPNDMGAFEYHPIILYSERIFKDLTSIDEVDILPVIKLVI